MSQAAQAFAPGSPANAAGVAQAALSGQLPGISVPGFTSSSSSKSGDIQSSWGLSTNGSGFSVNYGSGVLQGGALSPLLLAGLAVAGFLLWKRSK